jgi:hypothetical protein
MLKLIIMQQIINARYYVMVKKILTDECVACFNWFDTQSRSSRAKNKWTPYKKCRNNKNTTVSRFWFLTAIKCFDRWCVYLIPLNRINYHREPNAYLRMDLSWWTAEFEGFADRRTISMTDRDLYTSCYRGNKA